MIRDLIVGCLLAAPKMLAAVVLDMVLGPAEDFEYVSRTTPL